MALRLTFSCSCCEREGTKLRVRPDYAVTFQGGLLKIDMVEVAEVLTDGSFKLLRSTDELVAAGLLSSREVPVGVHWDTLTLEEG